MFAKKVSDKERKQMAKQEKKQAALEKKVRRFENFSS